MINFKLYKDNYISHVIHENIEKKYIVTSISKNNPTFKYLKSTWNIDAVGPVVSNVNYSIEYEFNNYLYQKMSSMLLNTVARNTLDSFVDRTLKIKSLDIETNPQLGKDYLNQDEIDKKLSNQKKKIKLGPISLMTKPRIKVDNDKQKQKEKVDELIINKLAELKQQKLLKDEDFFCLTEKYIHNNPSKEAIKDLYMLNKDLIIDNKILSAKLIDLI